MKRDEFLRTCAYACISGVAVATLFQSCTTTKHLNLPIEQNFIALDLKQFELNKKGKISFRKYLIVENENLNFPICVYRYEDASYGAFLLSCTHQGAELQVFDQKIVCPAHGSEFNQHGNVENGPAVTNLRAFKTELIDNKLHIILA